jgi:hypothetical protein
MRTIGRDIGKVVLGTAMVLALPLTAMQLSSEVRWDLPDFALMGSIIAALGMMFVLVARRLRSRAQRMLTGAALAMVLLLVWVELAVGVFGTPLAGS